MNAESTRLTVSLDQFSGACDKKSLTQKDFLNWSFKVFGDKKKLSSREQKNLFQDDLERLFWNGVLPLYAVRAVVYVAELSATEQSFVGSAKELYRRRSYRCICW